MKILVAGFFHETMTFSKNKSTMKEFTERPMLMGSDLYGDKKGTKSAFGAFIDVANERNVELVFSINVAAVPSGMVTKGVFDLFIEQTNKDIKANPDLNGIVLNLHGAAVVEGISDPEGFLLKNMKELTDYEIPITAVLDYHANIGQNMITYSDALIIYKTYPHIDMYQCGLEAINILIDINEGKIKPKVAYRNIPMISPLLSQGTFSEPMKGLIDLTKEIQKDPKIISASLAPGFGYADIPENGFSIIVISNNDQDLAQEKMNELSEAVWEKRFALKSFPVPVVEAVQIAKESVNDSGPILLPDVSDNPGGGAAGDGVVILKELLSQKVPDALVSSIWDAETAKLLHQHQVGAIVSVNLGGKSPEHLGTTLHADVKILALKDGEYINKGPFNTGVKSLIGLTALIQIEGIKVIVHEKRAQTLDKEIIRFTGINPEDQQIIVIKSTIHYRADFEPISFKIIEVDAPGPVYPNLEKYEYKNIRRPIYPLDNEMAKPF